MRLLLAEQLKNEPAIRQRADRRTRREHSLKNQMRKLELRPVCDFIARLTLCIRIARWKRKRRTENVAARKMNEMRLIWRGSGSGAEVLTAQSGEGCVGRW
jgi:hypothetical protein